MDAVDSYIPLPERDKDKPFLMPIEDVFSITGRGTVVTGRVDRGMIKTSDEVEIVGFTDRSRKTVATGVEMFRKILDQAEAGDNIGVLLRGIDRESVEQGQVLAKRGHCSTKFKAQVYVLKKEGGRHAILPYRPQLCAHHRCDRQHYPAGRCRDGHAGDDINMDIGCHPGGH